MDALYEMIITLLMILFWAVELLYGLLDRVFVLIMLSFLLLMLWVDELFPLNREFKIPFNTRVFITIFIVLIQQTLRFFL